MFIRSLFFSLIFLSSMHAMDKSFLPVEKRSLKAQQGRLRALQKGSLTMSQLKVKREEALLSHHGISLEEHAEGMRDIEEIVNAIRLKQQSEK